MLYLDAIASKENDDIDWTYDINNGFFVLVKNKMIFAFILGKGG